MVTSFSTKLMKRTPTFMRYFQSSYQIVYAHKILLSENFHKKNDGCLKMLTNCYSFCPLSTTFATKLIKRPTVFITYIRTSYKLVHVHKLLLSARFLKENGSFFNILRNSYPFRKFKRHLQENYRKDLRPF